MLQVRQLDIYVSVLLIAGGAYITYQGLDYGYAEDGTPGAGFFPFWVGLGLAAFAAINLFRALHRTAEGAAELGLENIPCMEIAKVLGASALMAGFIALSFVIGMTAGIFVLMLAIGVVFGPRTVSFYIVLTVLSLATTAILHLTFANLLGVPLL